LTISIYTSWLNDINRIKFTFLHTSPAFDAFILIDKMGLFPFAADGINRTISGAKGTADAVIGVDNILHQGLAIPCPAFFHGYMFNVFIIEIIQT
jgi:hypothetical protein